MSPYSPTLRGRRLGLALRQLREDAGLPSGDVAHRIGWSASKLSRVEMGRAVANPDDVRGLLAMYHVAGQQAEALVALAREVRQRPWWRQYSEVVPAWFETYLDLETDACRLVVFELGAVPDLLQTQDYTTAVLDAHPQPRSPDEQAMVASLWRTRQNRLTGDAALELDVVIAEGALRQRVGGPGVMQAQLNHLADAATLPNVIIRVLPFGSGAHPAMTSGTFSVLEFSDPQDPNVAYLAQLTSGIYLDSLREVGSYRLAYEQLRTAALGPQDSAEFIARLASELPAP